ncbi:hypothetical protein [Bryobacter aggregatus]|uniref:hypothetical protein n=1 Tax=Bryobacter aggregatus TaxID=360054 RepID=UPI00138DFA4B|nr:hypothetical protein [Bryobacter aggregatus]
MKHHWISTLSIVALFLGAVPIPAQEAPTVAKLQRGEQLGHLFFTVRANYIAPEAVTIEEGWYQVHIYNPNRVLSKAKIALRDASEKILAVAETKASAPQDTMFYRFNPGQTILKIDDKKSWSITINVAAKKQ